MQIDINNEQKRLIEAVAAAQHIDVEKALKDALTRTLKEMQAEALLLHLEKSANSGNSNRNIKDILQEVSQEK